MTSLYAETCELMSECFQEVWRVAPVDRVARDEKTKHAYASFVCPFGDSLCNSGFSFETQLFNTFLVRKGRSPVPARPESQKTDGPFASANQSPISSNKSTRVLGRHPGAAPWESKAAPLTGVRTVSSSTGTKQHGI
jgi:hypothetical protein